MAVELYHCFISRNCLCSIVVVDNYYRGWNVDLERYRRLRYENGCEKGKGNERKSRVELVEFSQKHVSFHWRFVKFFARFLSFPLVFTPAEIQRDFLRYYLIGCTMIGSGQLSRNDIFRTEGQSCYFWPITVWKSYNKTQKRNTSHQSHIEQTHNNKQQVYSRWWPSDITNTITKKMASLTSTTRLLTQRLVASSSAGMPSISISGIRFFSLNHVPELTVTNVDDELIDQKLGAVYVYDE